MYEIHRTIERNTTVIDRTDLQLMLCEQIMETDTDTLMELAIQRLGHDLEIYNDETEVMIGSPETIDIDDPQGFKKWLGFMLYALGERVEMTISDDA